MSVIVKGMKMPKDKPIRIVLNPNGQLFVDHGVHFTEYEAVELPPHGRMGDLDKLEQMFVDIDNAPYSGFDGSEPFYSAEDAAQIIRLSPTIIEEETET